MTGSCAIGELPLVCSDPARLARRGTIQLVIREHQGWYSKEPCYDRPTVEEGRTEEGSFLPQRADAKGLRGALARLGKGRADSTDKYPH